MVSAVVLINCQKGMINQAAEHLASMNGISEVYSVAGRFDLVVMIRVKANEDLADVVTKKLQRVDGIQSTETLIAFRAYSKVDLDGVFSLGFERK